MTRKMDSNSKNLSEVETVPKVVANLHESKQISFQPLRAQGKLMFTAAQEDQISKL
jgi:hypothetical protein